ncbi:hypothetical protein EHS25_004725 [Saitozyma podzolica]|uniref:Uncharacterized protein n=1 Tax=Saitozyma podzolica TaxID=1890683 RepID=A0A427Y2N3_9TREE|nr:hypothetical protein EHS25_004725 [Saitozyma podzolica]
MATINVNTVAVNAPSRYPCLRLRLELDANAFPLHILPPDRVSPLSRPPSAPSSTPSSYPLRVTNSPSPPRSARNLLCEPAMPEPVIHRKGDFPLSLGLESLHPLALSLKFTSSRSPSDTGPRHWRETEESSLHTGRPANPAASRILDAWLR